MNECTLQVGHSERFNPIMQMMRPHIRRPVLFEGQRMGVYSERGTDVDVVLDLMIHDLDLVLSCHPGPVEDVRAAGLSVRSSTSDVANAYIQFESGCVASLIASRVSLKATRSMRLFQPDGAISIDFQSRQGVIGRRSVESGPKPMVAIEEFQAGDDEPLKLQLESFLQAVRAQSCPVVSGKMGRPLWRWRIACYPPSKCSDSVIPEDIFCRLPYWGPRDHAHQAAITSMVLSIVMARILIISGEASGDLHGANLAKALKARDPRVSLAGIGGRAMEAAGVRLVEEMGRFDVIGMVGPFALVSIIRRFIMMRRLFRSKQWDTVVFIDHPGLNMRLAYFAKAAGLQVVYYIAPQIWAWAPWRIRWIKQRVDHVLVILPFEKSLYDEAGVRCTFVGHPILDAVAGRYDRKELRSRFGFSDDERVIALLPGSRAHEVQVLLPILLEAVEKLARCEPKTKFILAQASTIHDNLLQPLLRRSSVPIALMKEQATEMMALSDLVLVASGTATLQAAVVGTPMVLFYRTTPLTFWFANVVIRFVIRVKWIGLVNLVAGRTIVPELIQSAATGQRLYEEALRLLEDRPTYNEMKRDLAKVRAALGEPGASARAAEVVLSACRA